MPIELNKDARKEAIASIERYFRENMEAPIGNVAAGALLGFFLEEVGPCIYNQAIADAQRYFQGRVADLEGVCYQPEFTYWKSAAKKRS